MYISGGTVSFSSCTITGNTAAGVRAQLKSSHRPDGIFTCLRLLVLAGRRCRCFGWHGELLIVHHHWQHSYLCACSAQNFPSPRWEFLLTCPIDSHLSIRIDIWFYQANVRACHACKLPIAPMGFSHVLRLCLQGGGVYVQSGSVTFSSCTITGNTATAYVRAHAQKFPSPRWESC